MAHLPHCPPRSLIPLKDITDQKPSTFSTEVDIQAPDNGGHAPSTHKTTPCVPFLPTEAAPPPGPAQKRASSTQSRGQSPALAKRHLAMSFSVPCVMEVPLAPWMDTLFRRGATASFPHSQTNVLRRTMGLHGRQLLLLEHISLFLLTRCATPP